MYKQLSALSKQCVTLVGNLRGYNSQLQIFIAYKHLWATWSSLQSLRSVTKCLTTMMVKLSFGNSPSCTISNAIHLSVEFAVRYNLKVCLKPGTPLHQHLHASRLVQLYKKARGPICPFIRSRCEGFHFLPGNYKCTQIPVQSMCKHLPGGNSYTKGWVPQS